MGYANRVTEESPIESIFRLSDFQKRALKKLGLSTARDLLYHFPSRYAEESEIRAINDLEAGEKSTVYGIIHNLKLSKAFRKRIAMAEGVIEDQSGKIKAVWFNQPYLAKMIFPDSRVRVTGKIANRKGEKYFANPEIEVVSNLEQKNDSISGLAKYFSPFLF